AVAGAQVHAHQRQPEVPPAPDVLEVGEKALHESPSLRPDAPAGKGRKVRANPPNRPAGMLIASPPRKNNQRSPGGPAAPPLPPSRPARGARPVRWEKLSGGASMPGFRILFNDAMPRAGEELTHHPTSPGGLDND